MTTLKYPVKNKLSCKLQIECLNLASLTCPDDNTCHPSLPEVAPSTSIQRIPVSLHLQLLLNLFLSSQQPPGQTMSYVTRTIIMRLLLSALQTSTRTFPAGSYSAGPKTQILPSLPLFTSLSGFPHLRCKLFA